jgi:iron(III) transport system ATP-binding protein
MRSIVLRSVSKRFGGVVAVRDLSFEAEEGESFSMLGPSGCGKTTTLRMIAGFEDLDEGEILLGDKLISSRARNYYLPPEKRDFGMVFQAFAVWPHLTVARNVSFPLEIRHLPRHEIVERTQRALQYTGLAAVAESYPNELSGGQKQRIALARSISFSPRVMLLDEPLSNLDPKMREEMRFEIKEMQRKFGFTIIYVTHDQAEAMALSDRIMVMGAAGSVEQVDSPVNIYTRPSNRFVFEFIGLSNCLPVEIREGSVYLAGAGNAGALFRAPVPESAGHRLMLGCRPAEVEMEREGGAGAQGTVKRRVMLGETIDYRVDVDGVELRVQKNVRRALYREGDRVTLVFRRPLWFREDGVAAMQGSAATI